ncbi:MAG: hypothetical protein JST69_08680 [Bacteroidetes bacterium]|nr:hypothetical protein [Bacteroidota bacterium]
MRVVSSVIVFLIFVFVSCDTKMNVKNPAQNYYIKYFGGEGSQHAVGLIANPDGTFYILGNSRAAVDSLQKIYLAKANAAGDVVWQRTFNESIETEARGFILTSDQKLAVVANQYTATGTSTVSLYFFDINSGAKISSMAIPVANTRSNSITQTQDQGFIISGNTLGVDPINPAKIDTLTWVYRMDNTLTPVWTANNTSGNNYGNSVKTFESAAGGTFYVYGVTRAGFQGNVGKKFYSFPLANNGIAFNASDSVLAFTAFGAYDILTDVFPGNVGSVITGFSTDASGNNFLKLLKMRSIELTYRTTYDYEAAFSIKGVGANNSSSVPLGKIPNSSLASPFVTGCPSSQVGYYFVANSFSTSTNSDILLLKTNLLLTPVGGYPLTFGGVGDDTAAAVAELPDGHIMILGTFQLGNPVNQYKIVLIKLNSQGKLTD